MKLRHLLLSLLAVVSNISAQALPIVEPTVELAETMNVDSILNSINEGTDYDVGEALVTRKLSAPVAGQEEVWIPLGIFKEATAHKLLVNAFGPYSNSAMTCEFVVSFNQSEPKVYKLIQNDAHSAFQLYSYKTGTHIGLALRYKNVAPATKADSTVNVIHLSNTADRWSTWDIDTLNSSLVELNDEDLEARKVTAAYEHHTVRNGGRHNFYGQVEGIAINAPIRFNSTVSFPLQSILSSHLAASVLEPYVRSSDAISTFLPINPASLAIGTNAQATTENSLAIGENAITEGDTKLAVDGDATLSGKLTADQAELNDLTLLNDLTVKGNTRVEGNLIIEEPQGDISAGIYQ